MDIRDGRVLAEPVDGWSMSNDWRMIALPNEDGISVIRLDDPDSILNMRIPNATATAFSNDARELVTADSRTHRVWQLDATPPSGISIGRHQDRVSDVFFTNDDRRIVAVSKSGPRLWSVRGTERLELVDVGEHEQQPHRHSVHRSMDPHGTVDGEIVVLDLATGKSLGELEGHEGEIVNLDISADGNRLISTARTTRFASGIS